MRNGQNLKPPLSGEGEDMGKMRFVVFCYNREALRLETSFSSEEEKFHVCILSFQYTCYRSSYVSSRYTHGIIVLIGDLGKD